MGAKRMEEMSVAEWEEAFPTEEACKAYLASRRFADGAFCPRCGATDVYTMKARPFHWICMQCNVHGYRFSVLRGTIFERTNKPLRDWFRVIHMMVSSKREVGPYQVYRAMGFGCYKTAVYMTSRIRTALASEKFRALIG